MKSQTLKLFTSVLFLAVLFTACDNNSTGTDNTTVEGLWKLKSTEGDVYYVDITTNLVTNYDFQGDAYDEGDNCYLISSDEILERNGDIFKFANPFDDENPIEVRITAKNNELTVEQPFGNILVTLKFSHFNGNIADFAPECAEEQEVPKTNVFGFYMN